MDDDGHLGPSVSPDSTLSETVMAPSLPAIVAARGGGAATRLLLMTRGKGCARGSRLAVVERFEMFCVAQTSAAAYTHHRLERPRLLVFLVCL